MSTPSLLQARSAAKAQALLKEAGVATPVAVTMSVLPRQDIKDIAQVVQEQLNKAGFKVELKIQELGQFIQDWRNSEFRRLRLDQCRQRRSGRLFLPHLPDRRLDQRVQVLRTRSSTSCSTARAPSSTRRRARPPTTRCRRCSPARARSRTSTYGSCSPPRADNLQGFDIIANRSLVTLRGHDAVSGRDNIASPRRRRAANAPCR